MSKNTRSEPTIADRLSADLSSANRNARYAFGKSRRALVPFKQLSQFAGAPGRDALAILSEQDRLRISKLTPERYRRMSQSAFAFYRGAAAVMASDLVGAPTPGLLTQACGDSHMMNFGACVTPEDQIIFDINDFDETLNAIDFTIDLRRLAASVFIAALDSGAKPAQAHETTMSCVRVYRSAMRLTGKLSPLEIFHARIDLQTQLARIKDAKTKNKLKNLLEQVRENLDADDNFPHLAQGGGAQMRIADRAPDIFHLDSVSAPELNLDIERFFERYRAGLPAEQAIVLKRYFLRDCAFKAVGVGSVGTFCAIGLFASGDDEPLFLQLKEAQHSVLERLAPQAAWIGPQGGRVVQGQKILQAATDIFLGQVACAESNRDFYVRRLKNRRLGAISPVLSAQALEAYAQLCAQALANAHARAGDPAAIAGYMGKSDRFDAAIADFACAYAQTNQADFSALLKRQTPKQPSSEAANTP